MTRFAPAITLTVLAAGIFGSARLSWADPQELLVEARYIETRTLPGETPKTVADGKFIIAADGRYRREHRLNGSTTVEIVDFAKRNRIVIDVDKRIAVAGGLSVASPADEVKMRRKSAASVDSRLKESLGTKTLPSGLVLHGVRYTTTVTNARGRLVMTSEAWEYIPGNPAAVPVLLETRDEVDGEIVERRLVDVSSAPFNEELFRVPTGYKLESGEARR